ncbi:MAG: hypothetical protein ACE5GZ_03180 [Gammaproteobacteria bacterium]
MRDEEIEKLAMSLYDPKLPYHNFEHIRTVLKEAEIIVGKCRAEGIDIDDRVVYYALLFHDAGYHEDHGRKGYDSKEAYSAALAERELAGNGFAQDMINKVKTAIMGTHCDGHCLSNEDKVVRAADLSGLTADYKVFKENTINLKREFEMMSGTTLTWQEWINNAVNRIELFLREDLDLTSDYYDEEGNSIFHRHARENLKTLMSDNSD